MNQRIMKVFRGYSVIRLTAAAVLLCGCVHGGLQEEKINDTMESNKTNCMLCGAELEYLAAAEPMRCAVCGNEQLSNSRCRNGHFVCDGCHSRDALGLILSVCRRTTGRNPVEMAMGLMDHPSVHMHGPEHHVLVGAVLLAAYRNAGGDIDLAGALRELSLRGSAVPGGACGNWGACGAAISTGIYMSLVTGSTPLGREAWRAGNRCTSCALEGISRHGGPRCCKRDSFIAIIEAVRHTEAVTGVRMELPDRVVCRYSVYNSTCLGRECPFHGQGTGEL